MENQQKYSDDKVVLAIICMVPILQLLWYVNKDYIFSLPATDRVMCAIAPSTGACESVAEWVRDGRIK